MAARSRYAVQRGPIGQRDNAAKSWCYTVQLAQVNMGGHQGVAFSAEDWNERWAEAVGTGRFDYAVYQLETAPETGRIHGQLFVKWANKVRWAQANSCDLFQHDGITGVHTEKAKFPDEARAYCMKEETRFAGPYEFGVWVAMGRRSDLEKIYDMVRERATSYEILDAAPASFIRYSRGIERAQLLVPPPLVCRRREVYLCYGESGCGKSYFARMVAKRGGGGDASRMWIRAGTFGWFDGYMGQRVALFDEFAGARSGVKLTELLCWIDQYNIQLPIKGGFTWWSPRYIWITTMSHPSTWYDYGGRYSDWRALVRRIGTVVAWQSVDHGNFHVLTGDDKDTWFGGLPGINIAHVESPTEIIDLT